jgi:FGGY-family pentulose kinase
MYILAIDVGTESLRAGLVDTQGRIAAEVAFAYPTHYPHPQWAEQDPEIWWLAAKSAVPACLHKAGVSASQVAAIGLDAFASTMVVADQDGKPLRPAILWMDARASLEARQIEATADPVLRYGGGQESVEWMLPRILWLKRHEPDLFARADRIVEALDWFTYRLTGRWTLSMNPITDLWHYVPSRGGWPHSLLQAIGLDDLPTKWPSQILYIGDRAGELSEAAASALGLQAGTPVACGGVDAHMGFLGLNALGHGQLGLIIGSSTVQLVLTDRPIFDPGFWGPLEDSLLKDSWLIECGQVSTGSVLRWFVTNLASPGLIEQAEARGLTLYAYMDDLADAIPPGSGGLIAHDYWQGNRTPIRDPLARGTLVGLTLWHTPAHIYRALLEASAYGNRHIVDTLEQAGIVITEIIASGGGARSDVWLQMHADICNRPIIRSSSDNACLVGSAIAGAVCSGIYPDIRQAADRMARAVKRFEPDPVRYQAYDPFYAVYRELYPAMRESLHRLAALGGA